MIETIIHNNFIHANCNKYNINYYKNLKTIQYTHVGTGNTVYGI